MCHRRFFLFKVPTLSACNTSASKITVQVSSYILVASELFLSSWTMSHCLNITSVQYFRLLDHCASVKLLFRSITAVSLELDNVTPSQYHLRSILPSPRSLLCKCQVTFQSTAVSLALAFDQLLRSAIAIMYFICLSDIQINIMLQIINQI